MFFEVSRQQRFLISRLARKKAGGVNRARRFRLLDWHQNQVQDQKKLSKTRYDISIYISEKVYLQLLQRFCASLLTVHLELLQQTNRYKRRTFLEICLVIRDQICIQYHIWKFPSTSFKITMFFLY